MTHEGLHIHNELMLLGCHREVQNQVSPTVFVGENETRLNSRAATICRLIAHASADGGDCNFADALRGCFLS